jgi:hypothetical protein
MQDYWILWVAFFAILGAAGAILAAGRMARVSRKESGYSTHLEPVDGPPIGDVSHGRDEKRPVA